MTEQFYVVVNDKTKDIHTGSYSSVSPKLYLERDARKVANQLNKQYDAWKRNSNNKAQFEELGRWVILKSEIKVNWEDMS